MIVWKALYRERLIKFVSGKKCVAVDESAPCEPNTCAKVSPRRRGCNGLSLWEAISCQCNYKRGIVLLRSRSPCICVLMRASAWLRNVLDFHWLVWVAIQDKQNHGIPMRFLIDGTSTLCRSLLLRTVQRWCNGGEGFVQFTITQHIISDSLVAVW